MDCPKCNNRMEAINDPAFSALKCPGCGGIWFRDGSHEIARTIEGAAAIDESDTHSAAAYNEVRDIDCPECKKKMIKMADRSQLHIQFEACSYCHGVFFDAGEFKDLTEFSFAERVKQAIETFKQNIQNIGA